ncbi:hypothetical protein CVT26_010632 [Gymnopilus dilepis]|uniref:Uncharacterized protein n=1 Tax=Gymnopilus dilepis TaxID=231916 RepID=A0A409Y0W4_9AGAR|nr:hypothetical protein CVT26_010632 [Gymnopilus dilepis]
MEAPQPTRDDTCSPQAASHQEGTLTRRPLQRQNAQYLLTDEEQALADAMMRSSSPLPEGILGKRGREDGEADDGGGDTEPEDGSPAASPQSGTGAGNSNLAMACQRYAVKKKLRPEQCGEVDAFLLDSDLGRMAKLYTVVLAVSNQIAAQQSALPPWTLSDDLKTNINKYALAVMLSVKIAAYKGQVPANNVLAILKRLRFDLPVGIEHDYANWEKVTTFVSDALTQIRSKMKKQIRDSVQPANNTNIYRLTQALASCLPNARPTVQLCARVALMRSVYVASGGGEKYWNAIDNRLKFIRETAGGSPSRVAKAFKQILQNDRARYGADEDYEIRDVVANEWQQQVDTIVEGSEDAGDAVV